jgi:sec-independent protein translocase protein TatA
MFGFGLPELAIILVIVLLVAGPSRLPQFGQALGSSIRGFRKELRDENRVKIDPPAS